MKNQLTILFFLLLSYVGFTQELNTTFKEYSYTEFFELIEKEQDSVFELSDAIIRFNEVKDSLFAVKTEFLGRMEALHKFPTIVIDKDIKLSNVHFSYRQSDAIAYGVLHNLHFLKSVALNNINSMVLTNSKADGTFTINNHELCELNTNFWSENRLPKIFEISNNEFNKGFSFSRSCNENNSFSSFDFYDNIIKTKNNGRNIRWNNFDVRISNNGFIVILRNKILGDGNSYIGTRAISYLTISANQFSSAFTEMNISGTERSLTLNKNTFSSILNLGIDEIQPSHIVEWEQFEDYFISKHAFDGYRDLLPDKEYYLTDTDSFKIEYRDKIRIQDPQVFAGEGAQRGVLYRYYRSKFDMVSANSVYINLKDLETERLKYLYETDKSFDTYFQWKVNQFLKVFSNYGTKPSKAIVFSVYVVFFFALIYLFFPNSWDKHGRNRIMNRYNFFFKYMKRKAGIHEVYMEDQQKEMMTYEQFKANITASDKQVPKFFTATALPLYKWAISGTKLSASILKRVDIMKGSWNELPKSKRIWKSILLVGAFLVAVLYDIAIKMLNALMLSINTFTTLGFGEIPIKGLPRYLAIIQGFIGWFMLTIFSVSLISQLLN